MVGLIDIAPAAETVELGGKRIPVAGLTIASVAALFLRFPALKAAFEAAAGSGLDVKKAAEIVAGCGDAVLAAVLAAGTGKPGDADEEAAARRLGLEAQVALLDPILRLTMPGGLDPFVARLVPMLERLNAGAGRASPGKAPASKPRRRSKR